MKETTTKEIERRFEQVNFQPYTKVILDTRKPVKEFSTDKENFYSVKLRASFRIRYLDKDKPEAYPREYPLKMYCTVDDWEKIEAGGGKVKGARLEAIAKAKAEAEEKCRRILEEHTSITIKEFDKYYKQDIIPKAIADANTVAKVYDVIIAEEGYTTNNAKSYKASKSSVLKFGGENLTFIEINKDWIRRYLIWLNRAETTGAIYLTSLAAVFNRAIDEEIIKRDLYPFGLGKRTHSIKRGEGRRGCVLDEEQTLRMLNLDVSIFEDQEVREKAELALDYWRLSYLLCGLNIADIATLKVSHLDGGILKKMRWKTRNRSRVILRIPLKNVIDELSEVRRKRGNKTVSPNEYVFPILNKPGLSPAQIDNAIHNFVYSINKGLSYVQRKLKFPADFTTYSARHTFARMFLRNRGRLEELQVLLGHKDITTTQNYAKDWLPMDQASELIQRVKDVGKLKVNGVA